VIARRRQGALLNRAVQRPPGDTDEIRRLTCGIDAH
jgi:hypothetical protein